VEKREREVTGVVLCRCRKVCETALAREGGGGATAVAVGAVD
jgi:hypothetical protein